jgi:hypothetical protein
MIAIIERGVVGAHADVMPDLAAFAAPPMRPVARADRQGIRLPPKRSDTIGRLGH